MIPEFGLGSMDRAEVARRLHRIVDLWEQNKLDDFVWTERIDRLANRQSREFRGFRPYREPSEVGAFHNMANRREWSFVNYRYHPLIDAAYSIYQSMAREFEHFDDVVREVQYEEKLQKIFQDRAKGMSYKECAARAGISESKAGHLCRERNAEWEDKTAVDRERELREWEENGREGVRPGRLARRVNGKRVKEQPKLL